MDRRNDTFSPGFSLFRLLALRLLVVLMALSVLTGVGKAQSRTPSAQNTAPPLDSVTQLKQYIANQQALFGPAANLRKLRERLTFLEPRAYPNDTVNWSAYQRAIEHQSQMPPATFLIGPAGVRPDYISTSWQFVGPRSLNLPPVIWGGQYGMGLHQVSGRVNAVAYDPQNAGILYLGAAGGGVWKSTTNGDFWKPISDNWPTQAVSSIAIDRNNSNNIYVGTGDFPGSFTGTGSAGIAHGLMKSTDGGTSWTNLGVSTFGTATISKVMIGDKSNIIIVCAQNGLWRSTNSGTTWAQAVDTNGVKLPSAVWFDATIISSVSPNPLRYVALGADNSSGSGLLYLSTDRGAHWAPWPALPFANTGQFGLALTAWNPDVLFVMSGRDQNIYANYYFDDMNKWITLDALPTNTGNVPTWSQAFYDWSLTTYIYYANPTLYIEIYAGLLDLWQGYGHNGWYSQLKTYTGDDEAHTDQHAAALNPNNNKEMLVGNDGGIYFYTFDPGSNSSSVTGLNNVLGITQFYQASFDPNDITTILAGSQDNGTCLARGDDVDSSWYIYPSGDGGYCAINPQNSDIQYASIPAFIQPKATIYHTGNHWDDFFVHDISPNIGSDSIAGVYPMVLDPNNPKLLYLGTNYLDVNTDNGDNPNWTYHLGGQQLSQGGFVQAIAIAPGDSNRIYTGSNLGEVWMTTDGGSTWTQINTGTTSLPNLSITSFSVDPGNPSSLLVGFSGTGSSHLWQCKNTLAGSARAWNDVSGSGLTALPDVSLNGIARDPSDPQFNFYVGTDAGVSVTNDGGAHWYDATVPFGLPAVRVNDLKVVYYPGWGETDLYAVTFGRGIWKCQLQPDYAHLSGFGLSPNDACGGEVVQGTVYTLLPAPYGGMTVNLSSTNPTLAPVPGNVTITQNTYSATFNIPTPLVQADQTVTLTATYNNYIYQPTLTLHPVLASVSLSPATVTAGNYTTGYVSLNCNGSSINPNGIVVKLSSSNPAAASVPASETMTSNINAFYVFTTVGPATTVKITASYGGVKRTATLAILNPVPSLTSISPATARAGSNGLTLTVNGAAFVRKSRVRWNGSALTTTYVSPTQLTATVGASLLTTGGVAKVTVFTPTPGGGTSNAANFTITNPVPTLTSITPNQATAGSGSLTITLVGTNFLPGANGSVVNWTLGATTTTLTTTYVSSTQLTATVQSSLLATAGTAGVSVVNSAPGGGNSNSLPFTINSAGNPVPAVTGISPSSEPAGHQNFIIEVIGANFVPSSVIQWNGTAVATGYGNQYTVTAIIYSNMIATPGTALVTVFTPGPGGGTSNAAVFTITNPNNSTPSLSILNPTQVQVNSGAFVLTIGGANFISSSTVNFGNTSLTPSSVSSDGSTITVTIPNSLLNVAQTVNVTVTNPPPGGGTSNALPFTIANPAPTINGLSPSQAMVNSGNFTLTITGSAFVSNSTVNFGSTSLTPSSVSADGTTITVTVPGALLGSAGYVSVTVTNPGPGGGTSNAATFTITNPDPTISSLNPNQAVVSSGSFVLTITGTGFVAGTVVNWQPTLSSAPPPLTPFYISADGTTIEVNIDASLINVPAQTVYVSVTNAAPGGGDSNALPFTIFLNP